MHVLPQDIKIDEKALEYASACSSQKEFLRQYLAVVFGHPLPGDFLESVSGPSGITREAAYAILCGYIDAVFLRPAAER